MEIKVRAWDQYDKKMVYDMNIIYQSYIDNEHMGPWMQFSSRKDKNGKEIYVDDILKSEGVLLIVRFGKLPLDKSGDCVCTYPAFYCRDIRHDRYYECCEIADWMEVVGNIHENGSLLVDDALALNSELGGQK